jgi:hypothetical protein
MRPLQSVMDAQISFVPQLVGLGITITLHYLVLKRIAALKDV